VNRQFRILVATLSVGSLLLLGCSVGASSDDEPPVTSQQPIVAPPSPNETEENGAKVAPVRRVLSASWATSYESVAAVTAASDAVVIGTVSREIATENDTSRAGAVTATVVFTDFEISVTEVLKGNVPDFIVLHQTGGRAGDVLYEIDDDPLLEIGASYLLFLKLGASGRFHVAGGPDGRLLVESGSASSLSAVHPEAEIDDLEIKQESLAALRTQIRAALAQ
jgi:hypothetical protein